MAYGLSDFTTFFQTMYTNLPQVEIASYVRGDDQLSSIDALVSRSVFESRDDYGSIIQTESVDFIIKSSALSGFFPVQRGDVITVGTDKFEIIEPKYRYCDSYHQLIRIHTKRIYGTDTTGGIAVIESTTQAKWAATTTDAAETEAFTGDTYTERFTIEIGRAYTWRLLATAMDIDNIVTRSWSLTGTIKRGNDGTVEIINDVVEDIISTETGTEDWDVELEADDVNKALAVMVTGEADKNIKWVISGSMNELRS